MPFPCAFVAAGAVQVMWKSPPAVTVPPGRKYDSSKMMLTVCKGDTITYTWSGNHGISATNLAQWRSCNIVKGTVVAPVAASSSFTGTAKKPGMKYYYCPVAGHCSTGKCGCIFIRYFTLGKIPWYCQFKSILLNAVL